MTRSSRAHFKPPDKFHGTGHTYFTRRTSLTFSRNDDAGLEVELRRWETLKSTNDLKVIADFAAPHLKRRITGKSDSHYFVR